MVKKLPEMSSSSGLGNIDDLMHNQGVSDLSWLDVDVEEYRRLEALPRQNLDIIPELSKALMEDDRDPRVPARIPLRRTPIVNTNPLEAPSPPVRSSVASVRDRVATYIMAGMSDDQIKNRLLSEFSKATLASSGPESLQVLEERGLLGNVYINASHFSRCAQDGPHREFVARNCKRSLYVLSKPGCAGCVKNFSGRCASFKKLIVDTVPYDNRTYAHYLPQLQSERRASFADAPQTSESPMSDADRKERLRVAFRKTPIISKETSPQTIQHRATPAKPVITEKDIQDFWHRHSSSGKDPMPSPAYLKASKAIMLGTASAETLIASSDQEARRLAHEHGILGHTYLDGDALGGPRAALDFIKSRSNTRPDFILIRASYTDNRSADALSALSKITNIVSIRPEINKNSFVSACNRALLDGRMSVAQVESAIKNAADGSPWARLTAQANMYRPPAPEVVSAVSSAPRGSFYHGDTSGTSVAVMDAGEVRRTISHMMNTGLSGKALRNAILARYSRSDLAQVPEVGISLSADDGVQGFFFIDPTAYPDFGRGCSEGAKQFRKTGAKNVIAGSSCTGCRLQTAPGWCSKYAKRIIRQIPEAVRRVAAERRRLPLAASSDAPITNPVEEWGLASDLPVEISPARPKSLEISISSPEIST